MRTIKQTLRDTFSASVHWLRLGGNAPIVILSVFVGILGGFGAIAFRLLIDGLQSLAIGKSGTSILGRLAELHWLHLLLLPAVGGLLVTSLVQAFAREAKGHGVPEVMEAVALHGGRIRKRVVAVKSLASALCIATGGSVGREGPIVQIGSALGSTIGQWLHMPRQRLRLLVGCGAAAGIAATFNAPVAGVMFAIEIILGNYAITTLTPLILSSVIATVVCHAFPAITGGNVRAFSIPFKYSLASAWEIPGFFVLGALAALVALAFTVSLYWFEDRFDSIRIPPVAKGVLGGLILGGIYLGLPLVTGGVHCFGIGYQSIEMALRDELAWHVLALLVLIKLLCTGVSIGSGGSGGIFAPSLFLGAMAGGAFGAALKAVFPASIHIHSGAYALVGMGAVVAGTTHGTITAILIIFELTGDYQIMLPLMISCVIAGLITTRLKKDSIYTQKLSRRGIELHLGIEATIMESTLVRALMHRDVPTVPTTAGFQEVLRRMLDENIEDLYVTDEHGALQGIISLNDVKAVINEAGLDEVLIAADLMDIRFQCVTPESTLLQCIDKFAAGGEDELPVVEDQKSRKLVGLVTHRSIFLLYNREVLRQGTLGLKYVHAADGGQGSDYVELAEGHCLSVLPVTKAMVGRTLRDLDLRARYHVNVVSIRAHRYDHRQPDCDVPDPEQKLKNTDSLVVVGPQDAIERIKREA
jgi:CIC family chloride channel protein